MHPFKWTLTAVAVAALAACSGTSTDSTTIPNGTTLKVALLETTDSYSTIFNFDVFYADNNGLKYQVDVTKPAGSVS